MTREAVAYPVKRSLPARKRASCSKAEVPGIGAHLGAVRLREVQQRSFGGFHGWALGARPNASRFSCGRNARPCEFYDPLSAAGSQGQTELEDSAPGSCMRWLGGTHLYSTPPRARWR
jgi:hypothetical protein